MEATCTGSGLLGRPGWRVLQFALLGFLVGELPGMLYGWAPLEFWGMVCAIVGALAGATLIPGHGGRCAGYGWVTCTVAVGFGMAVDFAVEPPAALASVCRSGSAWSNFGITSLETHLRCFPSTAGGMLLTLSIARLRATSAFEMAAHRHGFTRMTVLVLAEFGLMLVLMSTAMEAVGTWALKARIPWTADGMLATMMASMLLFFYLRLMMRGARRSTNQWWVARRCGGRPARSEVHR